jgi:hypothetical protein
VNAVPLHLFAGFRYNPDTGSIIGKTRRRVGVLTKGGYVQVSVRVAGKVYLAYAHRLAFHLMGLDAPPVVDHIDGDKANNKWANLRASTKSLNAQNLKGPRADNAVGFLGVHQERRTGRFVATLRLDGKNKHVGSFASPEEAYAAYLSAKTKYHPHSTL